MNEIHILIIDDETKLRGLLARILGLEGYLIHEAADAKKAWKILENEPIQLVLCDVKLPDAHGVSLTAQIKAKYPFIEIIVLTAYGTIADGVQAMKNGAFDYLTKGDDNDKILPLTERAIEKIKLQKRIKELEGKLAKKYSFEAIIGKSPAIREAIKLAQKVAQTDTSVLLLGETGTGKEVFAQAIHQASPRHSHSFVAVNCSAFGKDILESELFGYKAGAFTGAIKDKKGLLEEAHQGTIFLDEIGEMNLDLQAKLLRVLETQTFIKVGDTKPTHINIRIISATNRDLAQEAEIGHFRADLYYRLAVFQIKLPALRERREDIELMAQHFLQVFSAKMGKPVLDIQANALKHLREYVWKGNIRELKNVIERAVILTDKPEISEAELPMEILAYVLSNHYEWNDNFDLAQMEKQHIQKVLQFTKGNKTETARLLNIGLTTLYRKLQEYEIV
ncbi:MAG: sigma-54 dependent transcriptional regulator [Microscillaceae bacterium]|nr:sigma-54 dependent transcriptional regulator [Microscillaceae bacterium]